MESDFDFVERVLAIIDEKRARLGPAALSPTERFASDIWGASGIIANGSFQYFFECGLNAEACADGYEAIGLPEVGRVFRIALSLFPHGGPHDDVVQRIDFVREREEIFDKLGLEVMRHDGKMETNLAGYLRNAGYS